MQKTRGCREKTQAGLSEQNMPQKGKKNRYSGSEVREMMGRLKEEYEEITGAQKSRIVSLRENLECMNKELEDAHKERVDIACALLNARKCADRMLSDAREESTKIIGDAKKRRDKLKAEIAMYELTLYSIRSAAKRIVEDIDAKTSAKDKMYVRQGGARESEFSSQIVGNTLSSIG